MEIKDLTLRLLLLGIPGISCFFLLRKLIGKIGNDAIESALSIFALAILTYGASDFFFWISHLFPCLPWGRDAQSYNHLRNLFAETPQVDEWSVVVGAVFSVPVACLMSVAYHQKWWNRACQKLRISHRFGDEDLFVLLLDGGARKNLWYVVRDHKESLSYYGAVVFWSDDGPDRELILSDVDVYSNEGEAQLLYSCKNLYVCRNRDDISIEVDPTPPAHNLTKHERQQSKQAAASGGTE
jgi:hypothetical protein